MYPPSNFHYEMGEIVLTIQMAKSYGFYSSVKQFVFCYVVIWMFPKIGVPPNHPF